MYNGMIVTLSSFLDVTDLEVVRIRVRKRRVPKAEMKTCMKKKAKKMEY